MGTIQGTLQCGAKIGPLIEARFHLTFLQCAQECAQSMITIGIPRNTEPIAAQGISGKAAVFQTVIIAESPSPEKFAGFAKCLRAVYVQNRDEVAERPKAAAC